jgi:hypothetical protein
MDAVRGLAAAGIVLATGCLSVPDAVAIDGDGGGGQSDADPAAPDAAPSSLVAHWRFDGDRVEAVGDRETSCVADCPTDYADGVAMRFGGDDCLEVEADAPLTLARGTIAVVFFPEDSGEPAAAGTLVARTPVGETEPSWRLAVTEDRRLTVDRDESMLTTGGGVVPEDAWSVLAASWGEAGMHAYVDGEERTGNADDRLIPTGAAKLQIGCWSTGDTYEDQLLGAIGDLRLYDGQLDAADIAALNDELLD